MSRADSHCFDNSSSTKISAGYLQGEMSLPFRSAVLLGVNKIQHIHQWRSFMLSLLITIASFTNLVLLLCVAVQQRFLERHPTLSPPLSSNPLFLCVFF